MTDRSDRWDGLLTPYHKWVSFCRVCRLFNSYTHCDGPCDPSAVVVLDDYQRDLLQATFTLAGYRTAGIVAVCDLLESWGYGRWACG